MHRDPEWLAGLVLLRRNQIAFDVAPFHFENVAEPLAGVEGHGRRLPQMQWRIGFEEFNVVPVPRHVAVTRS